MSLLSRLSQWARFNQPENAQRGGFMVSFGEPESVTENDMTPYLGTFLHQQEYYMPPIDKAGLAKVRYANGFHSRMPGFRRDKLLNLVEPNKLITRQELGQVAANLLVTGDAFIGIEMNAFQQPIRLYNLPSVYMRVMPEGAAGGFAFCQVVRGEITNRFYAHEVIHLKQDDLVQQVYGVPEYYGAIQSVLLNEAATLFRRKYYINGAHLGSLFISTSQALKPADEKAIAEKIRRSKGVGNWRSMFLHLPGHAQKASDVFNVVPVGDVATKDEFKAIKEITDRDISAAWGTRPEVAGIMPEAIGSTGDLDKLYALDYENKTLPLANLVSDSVNERVPPRHYLSFKTPQSLTALLIQE